MRTPFSVALFFVLCRIETDAVDYISRQEFDEFKTNVLDHIKKLTLENDRQSILIGHQRQTILDLKKLLEQYMYEEAPTNLSPEELTNILNDNLPVKHSRSFTKDSLVLKPRTKRAVKSMYFHFFLQYVRERSILNFILKRNYVNWILNDWMLFSNTLWVRWSIWNHQVCLLLCDSNIVLHIVFDCYDIFLKYTTGL